MGKTKRIRKFESFETDGTTQYAALYWDMLDSKAWQSLTPHEISLYIYMRRKYSRTVSDKGAITWSNKDNISATENEIRKGIELYVNKQQKHWVYEGKNKLMSVNTFWKSIDGLIDKGFIIVKHRGTRYDEKKCNIYAFHDGWKLYPKYQPKLEHTRKSCIV